jgi:hypothetical protein
MMLGAGTGELTNTLVKEQPSLSEAECNQD